MMFRKSEDQRAARDAKKKEIWEAQLAAAREKTSETTLLRSLTHVEIRRLTVMAIISDIATPLAVGGSNGRMKEHAEELHYLTEARKSILEELNKRKTERTNEGGEAAPDVLP